MKRFFAIFLLSAFCLSVFAQKKEKIEITHGPWLIDMTEDAVTVVWTTNKPALSWVEVCEASDQHFYNEEHQRVYASANGRRLTQNTLHKVRLTGLKGGTKYFYRIFSQETLSWKYSDYVTFGDVAASVVYKKDPYAFTTFSPNAKEVNFVAFNDIHGRAADFSTMCDKVDFGKCDFVLINGDMISMWDKYDQLFNGWLDVAVEKFASNVPMVFCKGNHENRGQLADMYFDYLPNSSGKFYYSFNVGHVNFLVLDGGEDKPDSDIEYAGIAEFDTYRAQEAEWLAAEVKNKKFDTRIIFSHIPPTTSTWHGDLQVRKLFLPLLNKSHSSVMFSGHTHKFSYLPPDSVHNFPIWVNDNRSVMTVNVTPGNISVQSIAEDSANNQELNLKVVK